jgi:voltage-gated potassium channel
MKEIKHLLGLIAAGWRVIEWSKRKFTTTPLLVILIAGTLHIVLSSAMLRKLEPTTLKTLTDAVWYVIVTISTIGYGDLVPQSVAGKAVAAVVMLTGITLAGIFIGFISELVHQRLETRPNQSSLKNRLDRVENELLQISRSCARINALLESREKAPPLNREPSSLSLTDAESDQAMSARFQT